MLRKFSTSSTIKVVSVGEELEKQGAEQKFRVHKITKLNPEFTYVRFRAIGNLEIDGPNANFDAFPYGEFEDERPNYGYKSFEGKRAFVEHASSNIENSIGSLYGSYLNRFNTSKFGGARWYELQDDQRKDILTSRATDEDGSIEVLMGIDKKLSPSIARMVETDSPTGCSMGTNIDYSECSVCGNRAYYESGYCNHIKYSKGSRVFVPASQLHDLLKKGALRVEWLPYILSRKSDHESVANNDRRMVYANVFEVNYGLSFFELSVVANPAFHRGYKLEKVASTKRGTRQLIPMMITPNKEIEVRLNVSEPYFQKAVKAYADVIQRPYDDWTNQDKVEFLRDAFIAKNALDHGAVEKVLISQIDAPELQNMGIETSASSDPGFYEVINPEQLLNTKYATIISPSKLASTQEQYACSWCKQVYAKENNQLDKLADFGKFSQYSVCPSCAVGVVQREFSEQRFAAEARPTHVLFRDTEKDLFNYNDFEKLVSQGEKPQALVDALYRAASEHSELKPQVDEYVRMLSERFGNLAPRGYPEKSIEGGIVDKNQKKAVYDGLPSTAEDIKDKGIAVEKTELSEYREGAKIGSDLIDKEKETRHPGTIFVDLHETKVSFDSMLKKISSTKSNAKSYLDVVQKIKSKGAYPEMVDDMKALPKPSGMDMPGKPVMGPESKEPKEFPKPSMESGADTEEPEEEVVISDVEEALENTVTDLEEVITDLETLVPEVAKEEEEIEKAEASVKRWSKRSVESAKSIYLKADERLQEAQAAIKHARKIISNIILQKKADIGGTMGKKSDGLTISDKDLARLASMNAIALKELMAEDKAEKDEKSAEKEESKAEKEEKAAEKDEKKAEKEESKAEKDEKKAEKFEEKAEKEEKKAAISDYPESVDGDKSEKLYEHFEHTDGDRKKKDTPKKSVEAAAMPPTGARDLGDYSDPGGIETIELTTWWKEMYPQYEQMKAKERRTDFDSPEGKVDMLTGVVARLVRKPKASKSFYGILKVAQDGAIQDGMVATFEDVAGSNQTADSYNQFTSPDFMNSLVDVVKTEGIPGAISALDGGHRITAQMEGLTPGKTDEVNPLYDAYQSEKDSNKPRPGVLLKDHKLAEADQKAFYKEMGSLGDPGYASDMVKKYKMSSEASEARAVKAEGELETMKKKETVKAMAKRALHLSRIAASVGLIPFDKDSITKQAEEYITLNDGGYRQVKSTLDKLPVTNKRAIEAYQIPEAEHMQKGVVHNSINAVHTVREEHKAPEDVDVEGLQPAVENNAKLSSKDEERIRKQAASIVPQISADPTQGGTIPNFTSRFRTIGNDLRNSGQYDQWAHKLNRRKQ